MLLILETNGAITWGLQDERLHVRSVYHRSQLSFAAVVSPGEMCKTLQKCV